jgi:hypothetical protein
MTKRESMGSKKAFARDGLLASVASKLAPTSGKFPPMVSLGRISEFEDGPSLLPWR